MSLVKKVLGVASSNARKSGPKFHFEFIFTSLVFGQRSASDDSRAYKFEVASLRGMKQRAVEAARVGSREKVFGGNPV